MARRVSLFVELRAKARIGADGHVALRNSVAAAGPFLSPKSCYLGWVYFDQHKS